MAPASGMQMTKAEFDMLPETVRRKCFSASERLQFERPKASNAGRRSSPPQAAYYSHASRPYHSVFAPGLLASSTTPIHPPPRPVHCSALRPAAYTSHQTPPIEPTDVISPEFARFYGQLPDKVKRRQFSSEERELLDSHAERVTPRLSARLSRNRSVPSLRSDSSDDASSFSQLSDELVTPGIDSDDMDAELMSAFQWIDESSPDLTLDDYHNHVSDLADTKPKWLSQVPGFRRHRSYSNFSLRSGGRPSIEQRTATAGGGARSPATHESWRSSTATEDPSAVPPMPPLEILKATTVTVHQSPSTSPIEPRRTNQQARAALKQWGPGWGPTSPLAQETLHRRSGERSTGRTSGDEPQSASPKVSTAPQARGSLEQWGSGWAPTSVTPKVMPIQTEHAPHLSPEARLKLEMYLAETTKPDAPISHELPAEPVHGSGSSFEPSPAYGEVSGVTFLDDTATDANPRSGVTEVSQTASGDEKSPVEDAPSFGHDARPSSSSYEPTHSGPPTPQTVTNPGDVAAPSSHQSDSRAPYIYALPPISSGHEMTLRMTLTRPELREDARAILPPTPAYVSKNPPPRVKFLGAKREPVETVTALPASRNPLGLDELFAPDPIPLRQDRAGLRKLFGRK